jgi:hypothetical protein
MLVCKKCHCLLAEGLAQQTTSEMEATLLTKSPAIHAHRQAMMKGPLCDSCLASWQEQQKVQPQPESEFLEPPVAIKPVSRSPAMQQLHDACLAIGGKAESRPPE